MDRYSKIKLVNNSSKSRSIDFSDHQSFPLETKNSTEPRAINFETRMNTNLEKLNDLSPTAEANDENNKSTNEGRFGMVKLSRNRSVSVSNSASNRFTIEKQSTNAVMKRAFSMRSSSSVSEIYCRIHDQTVSVASPLHDDDMQQTSVKNKKKYSSSRILKACKRLLGI